ncbi:MAG: hypothetical protein GX569_08930 [Candidatus Riflebacteria bacterium]|nr:hypothetical protein [Candidatus Riflebacteria bacterium]
MLKKPVIVLFCLVTLSLAIIGCGGGGGGTGSASNPAGPTLTSGETASLSGTVLFDNTPTPFATVNLYKSEKAHTAGMAQMPALKGSLLAQQVIGDGAWSTTTNGEGVYNFTDIPVGQYTLIAMRDENHQFVQTGVLLGQVTTLNPQLTPTGKISGKVTQTIGGVTQNISGAFVYITGTSYIALTNSDGNFTINNVPSNSSSGTAYEIQVISAFGDASAKTGITVRPGETTNVGTFALAAKTTAFQTLSGSLIAGTGVTASELGGIFVMLTRKEDNSLLGTNTDASGNYAFSVTMPGNYVVTAVNTDYIFEPGSVMVTLNSLSNSTTNMAGITLTTAKDGSNVSGTVTWGAPTSGWTITEGEIILQNQSGTPSFVARRPVGAISPANFSFTRVPPGNYTLRVDPASNGYQSNALNVAVSSGVDVTGANLSATFYAPYISTTSITGNVLTLNGGPFQTAAPLTQASANGINLTATGTTSWTTSVCKFDISNLPPGNYSVMATNLSGTTKVNSNQKTFTRGLLPPTNITAESTDTSITFTWNNAPFVSEVSVELWQETTQIVPPQNIAGSSHTYKNLRPGTEYSITVISHYPNQTITPMAQYSFSTKSQGLNFIKARTLLAEADIPSNGTIFGFEVYNNKAYIAATGMTTGAPITLFAVDLTNNTHISTTISDDGMSPTAIHSLAVHSGGIFLTHVTSGAPMLTKLGLNLTGATSKSLVTDPDGFGLGTVSTASVRSFDNRLFLVARYASTYVCIYELDPANLAVKNPAFSMNTNKNYVDAGKSAEIAYDRSTNALYLICVETPGDAIDVTVIRAFTNADLSLSPPIIGTLEFSQRILGASAIDGKINIAAYGGSPAYYNGYSVDSLSGYQRDLSSILCLDYDAQGRVWICTAPGGDYDYFHRVDQGLIFIQSLLHPDYAAPLYSLAEDLTRIRLDKTTGMMYMLHMAENNDLATYYYDSNY